MATPSHDSDDLLRKALEGAGHRFTAQRAAVYRFLSATDIHPRAEDVFRAVRSDLPDISLATVYKSLETLVGCGLAVKLTYPDESARYDGRTDHHHHARCLLCGTVIDVPGDIPARDIAELAKGGPHFSITGYRLELSGYCATCVPEGSPLPATA